MNHYKRRVYNINYNFIINESYVGESIETKCARVMETGEPIKDSCEPIFQERSDGVNEHCNIRADKWDSAIDLKDKVAQQIIVERAKKIDISKTDTGNPNGGVPTSSGAM